MRFLVITAALITLAVCIVGFKITTRPAGAADQPARYQGKTAFEWHRIAVRRRLERDRARNVAGNAIRAHRRDRRLYLHKPTVREAIALASITFSVPLSEMLAVARCETGDTFDPYARNRSSGASGIFQFLPSTFRRTPFARMDIFSPYANSLAAAWLYVQDGRSWREWTCKP